MRGAYALRKNDLGTLCGRFRRADGERNRSLPRCAGGGTLRAARMLSAKTISGHCADVSDVQTASETGARPDVRVGALYARHARRVHLSEQHAHRHFTCVGGLCGSLARRLCTGAAGRACARSVRHARTHDPDARALGVLPPHAREERRRCARRGVLERSRLPLRPDAGAGVPALAPAGF
jgi:hypothetical protein